MKEKIVFRLHEEAVGYSHIVVFKVSTLHAVSYVKHKTNADHM